MRQYPSTNKLYFQTSDVICNPENPENPDSKPMRQYPFTNKLYFQTSDIIINQKKSKKSWFKQIWSENVSISLDPEKCIFST
jgi:hypothetical protein